MAKDWNQLDGSAPEGLRYPGSGPLLPASAFRYLYSASGAQYEGSLRLPVGARSRWETDDSIPTTWGSGEGTGTMELGEAEPGSD